MHRIWQVTKRITEFLPPGGMLARVNRILVESAVLYTTSMLVDFIATLARSVSLLGLTDIVSYLISYYMCSNLTVSLVIGACGYCLRPHHHPDQSRRSYGTDTSFHRLSCTAGRGYVCGGKSVGRR